MSVSFFKRQGFPALAYDVTEGHRTDSPTIMFFPGYKSDMQGNKTAFLATHAAQKGQTMIRFDYRGHGQSEGRFEDGTIGLWRDDALAVFDEFVQNKTIIVGSSMGGWIGLLVAMARPEKLAGFIGIAAAPDFTRDVRAKMSPEQHEDLRTRGSFSVGGEYSPEPLIFTRALLEDGENHCIMEHEIPIDCPVRLLQGRLDADVPWTWANAIAAKLRTNDKDVIMREQGDHRLSTEEDLAVLAGLVDELSEKAKV